MAVVTKEEALQGNLLEFPLPMLLRSLGLGGQTGAVRLSSGGEIWFSDGRIYLASSPSSPELSSVLANAGFGEADEIDSMFSDSYDMRSVLDRLLPSHPDKESTARRLLRECNLGALFELIIPGDVDFVFDSSRRHHLGDRFAEDPEVLISQAENRLKIWAQIASRIPSTEARFRLSPTLPEGAWERLVDSEEWQLLALIDGHRTVSEIIVENGRSAFAVCSALFRLILEGIIVPVKPSYRRSNMGGHDSAHREITTTPPSLLKRR